MYRSIRVNSVFQKSCHLVHSLAHPSTHPSFSPHPILRPLRLSSRWGPVLSENRQQPGSVPCWGTSWGGGAGARCRQFSPCTPCLGKAYSLAASWSRPSQQHALSFSQPSCRRLPHPHPPAVGLTIISYSSVGRY